MPPCTSLFASKKANQAPQAYLQDYEIDGWPNAPLGGLPAGARGIDPFSGEEAMMGRGFGPRYLTRHCARLFNAGGPVIGIDPDPRNSAALRCYEEVGFRPVSSGARAQPDVVGRTLVSGDVDLNHG